MYLHLNIRMLRKRKKMTQIELAKYLGKSHTTIVNYEQRQVVPPLDILLKLISIFNVNLHDLVLTDLSGKPTDVHEVGEPIQKYQAISDDWQWIALHLGKDLRKLQEEVKAHCPKLWDRIQ